MVYFIRLEQRENGKEKTREKERMSRSKGRAITIPWPRHTPKFMTAGAHLGEKRGGSSVVVVEVTEQCGWKEPCGKCTAEQWWGPGDGLCKATWAVQSRAVRHTANMDTQKFPFPITLCRARVVPSELCRMRCAHWPFSGTVAGLLQ